MRNVLLVTATEVREKGILKGMWANRDLSAESHVHFPEPVLKQKLNLEPELQLRARAGHVLGSVPGISHTQERWLLWVAGLPGVLGCSFSTAPSAALHYLRQASTTRDAGAALSPSDR